jgi:hypoxanthine phosphoribosyltransferase
MAEKIVTLIDAREIQKRVSELGAQITKDYHGRHLVLVCVLKGSFMFTADLSRAIEMPNIRIEFLGVRSYGEGTTTSGVVQITQDLSRPIEGEDILIVEDIVDTGLTIAHLIDLFRTRKPASLKVCALLHKPARTRIKVPVDYLGFTIEDRFVVGYGLDWSEKYRNHPHIAVVEMAPSGEGGG